MTHALSPLIQAHELQQLIQKSPHLKIIDARFDLMNPNYGHESYIKGRIPTALRLDLEKDLCNLKNGNNGRHPIKPDNLLIDVLQNIGLNNDDHIIVYDDKSSMFASHAWWVLKHLGHENVQLLNGGITAWKALNGEIETTDPKPISKGNIELRESDFGLIMLEEILEYVTGDPDYQLQIIDARGEARFKGETEPLDPIAGHIPTAMNYPFEYNLNEMGLFKSPEVLRSQWQEFLQGIDPSTIVNQCGSGVSACHNLFSIYYADLGATQLYHGSWSEWCADPTRPMATKHD
ncbi:sulfurtransferase [Ignatzschineria rhizosphaerae]|uniref:Sulfurtransferase n=1 Tax=Ignatzschineria rhizosphaerae TaxID=2923279 RepID=A0ABY3X361_9GAMM|nr:sulfurtransferase [Ignatzschineria rhizosphaerae]UNM97289.1 sulfurtransferase [Ignatzschineria rhizosphaerae]